MPLSPEPWGPWSAEHTQVHIYTGLTPTHANLAALVRTSNPRLIPTALMLTDLQQERAGQQSLFLTDHEEQGLEASLSQRKRPRYSDYLQLEPWALNTVSSPRLAHFVWFLNWSWSFGPGATAATHNAASLSCPGTPHKLDKGW